MTGCVRSLVESGEAGTAGSLYSTDYGLRIMKVPAQSDGLNRLGKGSRLSANVPEVVQSKSLEFLLRCGDT